MLWEQCNLGIKIIKQFNSVENQQDLVNETLIQEKNCCKKADKWINWLQKELDQLEAQNHNPCKNNSLFTISTFIKWTQKLSDPSLFIDGETSIWDNWFSKIADKLEINHDHYETE